MTRFRCEFRCIEDRFGLRREPIARVVRLADAFVPPLREKFASCNGSAYARLLMAGEHCLHGITNRNIRSNLKSTRPLSSRADDPKKAISKFSRCSRRLHAGPDRQDPPHAPLESHQLRPQRHGHLAVPARAPLPQQQLRRNALIFFANKKERTERESIRRQVSITSAHRGLWAPSSSLASGLAADARISGCPRRAVPKRARSGSPS